MELVPLVLLGIAEIKSILMINQTLLMYKSSTSLLGVL